MKVEFPVRISERDKSVENTVVVVGAGIAGSLAALRLANLGEKVIVVERYGRDPDGHIPIPERSVITLRPAIENMGIVEAVKCPLDQVVFSCLDNGNSYAWGIPKDNQGQRLTTVIDYQRTLQILWNQLGREKQIMFCTQNNVSSIEESSQQDGVEVTIAGQSMRVKAAVDASGPAISPMRFTSGRIQRNFEQSIVAYVYGRRCRGSLLIDGGDRTIFHPISSQGSGRTSWINPWGDETIEIIHCDYALRKEAEGKGRDRYEQLKRKLQEFRLVEILEEGPEIAGFFGLEARLKVTGARNIFYFGERGMYNSGTVGDAIAPTEYLSKILASIIHQGKEARFFEKILQRIFNHRLELAMTIARMRSSQVGTALEMLRIIEKLSSEDQAKFLVDHRIPVKPAISNFLAHPHLFPTVLEIASAWLSTGFRL